MSGHVHSDGCPHGCHTPSHPRPTLSPMTDQPTTQPADTGSAAPPPQDVVRLAYDRIADYPAEQLNALADVLSKHMPFVPLSHRFGVAVLLAEAAAMSPPTSTADAEEREEWNSRTPADPEPAVNIGEEHAHRRTAWWVEHGRPATTVRRTVRTLVGPWVEVEG
jgi:hypothetical protein